MLGYQSRRQFQMRGDKKMLEMGHLPVVGQSTIHLGTIVRK